MATIQDYYIYSVLANASYINLDNVQINPTNLVREASKERIPTTLARQLFDPTLPENKGLSVWSIPNSDYYYGNDGTGFAATLFEKGNEKVLAIRGTEPFADYAVDLKADLAQIGFIGFALDQTVSMINYIQRLKGDRFIFLA